MKLSDYDLKFLAQGPSSVESTSMARELLKMREVTKVCLEVWAVLPLEVREVLQKHDICQGKVISAVRDS